MKTKAINIRRSRQITSVKFWKPVVLLAAAVFWSHCAQAVSTLPFYEPFPDTYTQGEQLGGTTSSAVWDSGSGTGTGSPVITSNASLTLSGLQTSGGRGLFQPQGGTARNRGASFTTQ